MHTIKAKHRTKHSQKILVVVIAAAILLTAVAILGIRNLRGMVSELALATATDVITITVNDVIKEKMSSGMLDYSNLVTLEKDSSGSISALVTNMANINTLQSEISNAVVKEFNKSDITEISVPIGNLVGGTLFSGTGPRIKLKTLSVTNVMTEFRNEFSTAGINQTRHQIMMDVIVDLTILFAGRKDTDSVTVSINVAETVIIGSVPNMYANME